MVSDSLSSEWQWRAVHFAAGDIKRSSAVCCLQVSMLSCPLLSASLPCYSSGPHQTTRHGMARRFIHAPGLVTDCAALCCRPLLAGKRVQGLVDSVAKRSKFRCSLLSAGPVTEPPPSPCSAVAEPCRSAPAGVARHPRPHARWAG